MSAPAPDPRLVEGVALFNRGEFFECHDVLEEYWNDLRGGEKLCVQGLIQTAVACYHAINGNYRGSVSQFDKALAKFAVHAPAMFGLESEVFLERIARLRAEAERGLDDPSRVFPAHEIPALEWTGNRVSTSSTT